MVSAGCVLPNGANTIQKPEVTMLAIFMKTSKNKTKGFKKEKRSLQTVKMNCKDTFIIMRDSETTPKVEIL